jgi:hypothetical protein
MGNKFILGQEDGTVAGGDARGEYAIDLQTRRALSNQVASAIGSSILGGQSNKLNSSGTNSNNSVIVAGNLNTIQGNNKSNTFIGAGSSNIIDGSASVIVGGNLNTSFANSTFIGGGDSNTANGTLSIIVGGSNNQSNANYTTVVGGQSNTASASHGTVSGGQSNVASTNTHATVVGGQSNTASGAHSVAGGISNVASGTRSTAFGNTNTASGQESLVAGFQNNVSGPRSFASGYSNTVSGAGHSIAVGWSNTVSGESCGVIGDNSSASGTSSFAINKSTNASGQNSFTQGFYTQTSTLNSSAFGYGGYTSLTNQQALGNYLSYRGDSQTSRVVYSINTGDVASGGTYTFTGGQLIVPRNSAYGSGVTQAYLCTAKFIYSTRNKVGTVNTINIKDCFTAIYNFAAKSTNNIGALIGTPTLQISFSDPNLASTVVSITIGASGEILFTFTPPTWTGGGTIEFRGTLHLEFTEIGVYS